MTALTILVVVGFPIVTVLAWLYDITPAGIVADTSGSRIALPRPRRSLAPWIVAGVTAMAAVTGFAWWRTIEQASLDLPTRRARLCVDRGAAAGRHEPGRGAAVISVTG